MKIRSFLFRVFAATAMTAVCNDAAAQLLAVKTNALMWGNLTPNLSMELVTSERTSVEGTVFYSPDNTPLDLQLKGAQAEIRYWISGRPMNRMFVGVGLTALRYDTGTGHENRHMGDAVAPGLVYGYALPLGNRWNIEFAAGVGYFWFHEKRYGKDTDIWKVPYNEHGGRLMPTKLTVSCAYMF